MKIDSFEVTMLTISNWTELMSVAFMSPPPPPSLPEPSTLSSSTPAVDFDIDFDVEGHVEPMATANTATTSTATAPGSSSQTSTTTKTTTSFVSSLSSLWHPLMTGKDSIPLDPLLSLQEEEWIRSVLPKEEENQKNRHRWMVSRCYLSEDDDYYQHHHENRKEEEKEDSDDPSQYSSSSSSMTTTSFEGLVSVLGNHPQTFFVTLDVCPLDQGPPTILEGRNAIWIHNVLVVDHVDETNNNDDDNHNNDINANNINVEAEGPMPDNDIDSTTTTTTTTTTTEEASTSSSSMISIRLLPSTTNLRLEDFLARLLRPTILWWDRQSTTPMAFHPQYRTHAVLVVDWMDAIHNNEDDDDYREAYPEHQHHNDNDDETKSTASEDGKGKKHAYSVTSLAVSEFAKVCHEYHFTQRWDTTLDVVCLVVPSTETRVLKTFGINIWDVEGAMVHDETTFSTLPAVFLTHRTTQQGIQRYYMDSYTPLEQKEGQSSSQMGHFFEDFHHGRLHPELSSLANLRKPKSSSPSNGEEDDNGDASQFNLTRYPNSHGVVEWTTYHVEHYRGRRTNLLPEDDDGLPRRHTLLLTYAPTCGHCKRMNVIWNRLGRLVEYLQWSPWLQVARIDVTTETFSEFGALMLPSIYYFYGGNVTWMERRRRGSSSSSNGDTTSNGNEQSSLVGGIDDPLEIVEWLLDVGVDLDEGKLLRDLLLSDSPHGDSPTDGTSFVDHGEESSTTTTTTTSTTSDSSASTNMGSSQDDLSPGVEDNTEKKSVLLDSEEELQDLDETDHVEQTTDAV